MLLYHRTTKHAAESILRDGFQDGEGTYMTTEWRRGVWLSDRPLDINEGARGDVLLRVELTCDEADLKHWEWREESKTCREWLVPAALVNGQAKVAIDPEDE